eukprot:g2154.t1
MARLVPYDPDLPYLFFGEEICMTLRMWTSGFDFFAPLENVAYHLWSRNYRPALDISSSEARAARLRSQSKVMDIITSGATSSTPLGQNGFGVGTVRSVAAYCEYSGVDLPARRIRRQFHSDDGGDKAEAPEKVEKIEKVFELLLAKGFLS